MRRAQRICYLLGMALAICTGANVALADQESPRQGPTELMAKKRSATATVTNIDTKDRELTLQGPRGDEFKVHVPEDVRRFDAIKKGDRIRVDYYESMALKLEKGAAGKEPGTEGTEMAERTPGKLPGGLVARNIKGSMEVMKVDRGNNTVTLRTPDGETDTIQVTDPAMQKQLTQLKQGDRIDVSYSQAIAISVMPPEKKGTGST